MNKLGPAFTAEQRKTRFEFAIRVSNVARAAGIDLLGPVHGSISSGSSTRWSLPNCIGRTSSEISRGDHATKLLNVLGIGDCVLPLMADFVDLVPVRFRRGKFAELHSPPS
ncbi:MAG: hypothetical protein OEL78_07510, partial [Hyphomicrobiales bacterium]|nr:hypothetical protein [Hyphomicrobiales bacterium]